MLGAMDSSIPEPVTIYVRLRDEGVPVLRPALAMRVRAMTFRLLDRLENDDSDETWEFEPGATVRCEQQDVGGSTALVAIAAE